MLPEVFRAVTDALSHLLEVNIWQTALLLDKDLPSCHSPAIDALATSEHKQMAYLRCLLDPSADDQDEKGPLPIRRFPSINLDVAARHRYVSLLCRHDPGTVMTFLESRGVEMLDLSRLAGEFEVVEFYEGQIWALDRLGKTKETFDTVGDVLRLKGANLGQAVVTQDIGTVHVDLQTLQTVSRIAIRLCQEHSIARTEHVEDMWFGVLHEIVELVHSVSGLAQSREGLDGLVVESLRTLVQETLQSLVSSSSVYLSFPRLFKRLVEASTPSSKAKKGRAYSESRAILTGMLDSYRAEGDMLSMTTRLVGADLFVAIQEITEKRQRGWRAEMEACDLCGSPMFTGTVQGDVVILGSGRSMHKTCHPVEEEKS